MRRWGYANQPARLRRIGTVVALFGLIFASTLASISHSIAMPMMASPLLQAAPHSGHDTSTKHDSAPAGHHVTRAAHDCDGGAATAAPQHKPQTTCDEVCMLCKNCTVTGFMLTSPIGIDVVELYAIYMPAADLALAGITPPSPNKPPKV